MLNEVFERALVYFKQDFAKLCSDLEEPAVIEKMTEVLEHKGFSKDEIKELLTETREKEIKYRFLAYFCRLYSECYTIEDVNLAILEQLGECKLSDEDIEKISKYIREF